MLCKVSCVSFCQLHCFSLFSGKCGKFVSSILIISLFITGFTITSSAASQSTISIRSMQTEWFNLNSSYTGTTYGSRNISGTTFTTLRCSNSAFYTAGDLKVTRSISVANINPDTRYRISFKSCVPVSMNYDMQVLMVVNNDLVNASEAYAYQGKNGAVYDINFTFVFRGSSSAKNEILLQYVFPNQYGSAFDLCLTDITLTDLDDNTGVLQSILDWLSRIYHSIAGGTDTQGVSHPGLIQGFTNAINNISNWLSNLGTAINNKLESVKTALKNAIDSIQGWLITLGEDLVQGLKDLFIPSEEYLDDFKSDLNTWLTTHFGALYQAPLLAVDFIRELLSIRSGSGIITLPDVRVEFFGHTYTILQSQTYDFNWVNNTNHVLHTFYTTYRAFTYIILILGLIHYCRNKYYQIFASMNDFAGGDD